jgi:hypothetical protein
MIRRGSIGILACVAGLLVVWLIVASNHPKTDTARYQEMLEIQRKAIKVSSAEKGRWGAVIRPLGLHERMLRKWNNQTDVLLATGYLTNACVEVSDARIRRGNLVRRIDAAIAGSDILVCRFSLTSNSVTVVCRPQDVPRLRDALRN